MTLRLLLPGLLLTLVAQAAEQEIIEDKDLEPLKQELRTRLEQARKNSVKIDDLVLYYQQQSLAKGTPRERATNAYMYGFVLINVLPPDKNEGWGEAKREFQRAVDLVPGFLPALADLSLIAENAGDATGAEELLRKALRLRPSYQRAHLQLGQMALRRGDFERAREIYERTLEEPTVQAFSALIAVYLGLFRKSFDEKEKERYASRALAAAEAVKTLEPDNQVLRLFRAEVLLNLGRIPDAIDYLETLHAAGDMKPELQLKLLMYLRQVYQAKGDVDGVKRTVERLLKCENLRPEERARISGRLKDLDTMGRNAFVKWEIEDGIARLHNEGLSVEERLAILRGLWSFILSDAIDVAELRTLVKLAWDECFRVLVDGPPELVVTQLRALRGMPPSPRLMAVLVHFVHPEGRTPEIREEGVRTIAALTGQLAIPAIYYTLQDDSGKVVREADSQLSTLCERRSPFGGGIEPYTPEQVRQVRLFWARYFHSEDGAGRMAKCFADLGGAIVKVKPDRTSAPMIDHAANVLLDDDVPWTAWAASYGFLVKYWGKEFRPVERRGKPVEPSEREAVVKAFDEEFKGRPGGPHDTDEPGPVPDDPKGMAGKRN